MTTGAIPTIPVKTAPWTPRALCRNFGVEAPQPDVSRVGQVFDGMEVQDRRGVVDSLQKYFRRLQKDIQREISPQERKQPEQNRTVR